MRRADCWPLVALLVFDASSALAEREPVAPNEINERKEQTQAASGPRLIRRSRYHGRAANGSYGMSRGERTTPQARRQLEHRGSFLASGGNSATRLVQRWKSLRLPEGVQRMIEQQRDDGNVCSRPDRLALTEISIQGLGSSLHEWASALCYAHQANLTLVTVHNSRPLFTKWDQGKVHCPIDPHSLRTASAPKSVQCTVQITANSWYFEGAKHCSQATLRRPMACLFGDDTSPCSAEQLQGRKVQLAVGRQKWGGCGLLVCPRQCGGPSYASLLMVPFSRLTTPVLTEAAAALSSLFGEGGVPRDMVTVHIRWGDHHKHHVKRFAATDYADAVVGLLGRNGRSHERANVFLMTEDMAAVAAFEEYAQQHHPLWTLRYHGPAVAMDSRSPGPKASENQRKAASRKSSGTGLLHGTDVSPMSAGRAMGGVLGLESIVSLLLSLEAEYFVLTTASNWGRLAAEVLTGLWTAEQRNMSLLESRVVSLEGGKK